MGRNWQTDQEKLYEDIRNAASKAFAQSGRQLVVFSKNLGRTIMKNKNVVGAFKRAKRSGYKVTLGLEFHISFAPGVVLENISDNPGSRARSSALAKFTKRDKRFLKKMKITL